MYSGQDPLHVWTIWSRWQIVCGSYNELMVLLQSIKMDRATRCDIFFQFCPQMLLAKFVANQWNGLGGVQKSKFMIFHSAWVAHGEVVLKSGFVTFREISEKKVGRKWHLEVKVATPQDSAQFSELVDERFLNVWQSVYISCKPKQTFLDYSAAQRWKSRTIIGHDIFQQVWRPNNSYQQKGHGSIWIERIDQIQ